MKLLTKILAMFSFASFCLSSLEAKSIELFLDHTPEKTFVFDDQCSKALQLKIENVGDQAVHNCFPYVNLPPCLSLDLLALRLAHQKYPFIALFQLWNQSVAKDGTLADENLHPLEILNFKGVCSEKNFALQFIKLCKHLGIKTRLANVHGKPTYDFFFEGDWNFIDLDNQQFYLALNNEKLVSSEEIMDDPFLALRTKHHRGARAIDFRESWKALSHFEILEPASATPLALDADNEIDHPLGLSLYPGEILQFSTCKELDVYECQLEHAIDLEKRAISQLWHYSSPFPIQKLVNQSSASMQLIDEQILLKPGEAYLFEKPTFALCITFTETPKGKVLLSGFCTSILFPKLIYGENKICLGSQENPSLIKFQYEIGETLEENVFSPPKILNITNLFDHCCPEFFIENPDDAQIEKIWWQISFDRDFQLIPSNFDQVENFSPCVTLSPINETFLSPGSTYYFRIKSYKEGIWSQWSIPFAFSVEKPLQVEEVQFEPLNDDFYELNWERFAEETNDKEPLDYLIFGSNAFDFIPSIYCQTQVNGIVNGDVIAEESINNLVAITKEAKIQVKGGFAYYRIIARKKGQLSVPSSIIHIYDQNLIQPRTVLQIIEEQEGITIAKRSLFQAAYPGNSVALPLISEMTQDAALTKLEILLRAAQNLENTKYSYELPEVAASIWDEVRPYLLPSNHPAWAKLNRVFCKGRATLSSETFKEAGFNRWRPGRWSRVSASSHPELKEYFIKAYCDVEIGILYDWKKWIHRIIGAETVRQCIKDYKLQARFKVPNKWIYPLPKNPAPPKGARFLRKNFILICENMRIQEHSANEKMYKKMNRQFMDGLYIILQVCGLYDSVYCFNIPFCKDGKIAVIDTEYHHKWPVPFKRLSKSFSKDMRPHWERITNKGGRIPDGVNRPNPPRMDRRDKAA